MGGSLVQAQVVYGYFEDYCAIDQSITASVEGNITASETIGDAGNAFNCVTASPKQVRGKHPDTLISDETCETSDELIDDALPMVNDSPTPLVIMASTFHKIFGRFAETWDNAEQRGYLRIQWDIFDVCLPFDPNIWDSPELAGISDIGKLKAFAKGRSGDVDGWIPIENIIQAWREKPTLNWFEVEYMGTRPSAAGLVLKPEDVDGMVFDDAVERGYDYVQGATVVLGIDWGFSSMTSVVELMRHRDDVIAMLDNKNYHQEASEDIIKDVVAKVILHGIRFIYADSAGKFENIALQNALIAAKIPCKVIEVVFGVEKEGMLGNFRAHSEQKKLKIPFRLRDAYYQYKNYRYAPGSDKPVKKDDHIPDASMCGLQHFVLGQGIAHLTKREDAPVGTSHPITRGTIKKTF